MNCPICQHQLEKTSNKVNDWADTTLTSCPCGVQVAFNPDNSLSAYYITTTYRNEKYMLTFVPDLCGKPEFYIMNYKEEVFRRAQLPTNITPTNASEKIKLYLLFS